VVEIPDRDPAEPKAEPKAKPKEAVAATPIPPTWSHWRGPEQTGVSRERDLPEKFSLDPKAENSNLIWRVESGGRSTPVVQNGRVYIINKTGDGLTEQERVMCFDEKDGKVLWEHKFNVFYTDHVSSRLGWTMPVGDPETGNVYVHGCQGLLFCFDKDGKIVWQHSLTEEYGRISGYGGRITSPIIDGELLLMGFVNGSWGEQAIARDRFVAMDKKTGKILWWSSTGFPFKGTYYSTPVAATIGGQRLLISGGGDGGVHAFKVRTGEKVWSYIFSSGEINCSPVVAGDRVYIGHGEENGNQQGQIICVDGAQVTKGEPKLIWSVDGIKAKYASPIIHDGLFYVCNDAGKLFCLDANTGDLKWDFKYGRNTKGSPVLADGKIYVAEVDSKFHILKPSKEGCERLSSQFFRRTPSGADVSINGSPAVANGRVYFMTSSELLCIGKKDHTAKADPIPQPPAEATGGDKLAHLQIISADVVLHPGESVPLKALAFNDKGRLIGDVKVEWSLAGMRPPQGAPPPPQGSAPPPPPPALQGELSEKSNSATTRLTANKVPPQQFGRVVATLGDLTADCRVRVVAPVPYVSNFAPVPEGRTPAGWVNCQGKFEVVALPGGTQKVLKKRANDSRPGLARANTFLNTPDMKDYTIEADVMPTQVKLQSKDELIDHWPDAGICCQRYTLMLTGGQALRLVSWDALPRVDKTVAFPTKSGEWYRMKLTVQMQGDQGLVLAKVWPRDKPEPKDWTIEFTDPIPNREGAPALYGFAQGILEGKIGTEIFFDNIKITPNKK